MSNDPYDINPETKRAQLIDEHLYELGVANIEDAPDEFLESAHKYADEILGVGKDN